MTLIKILEDRLFLTDQRTDRKGYMERTKYLPTNKNAGIKGRRWKRNYVSWRSNARERMYDSVSSSSMPLSNTDSNTSDDDGTDEDFNAHSCPMPDSHTIKKQRPTNIISPELASALDRTNVSNRNATYLLAATAQGLGHDVAAFAINRTSTRRARIAKRSQIAERVKLEFSRRDVPAPLTVHWDGTILPDFTGRESVDKPEIDCSVGLR